jgi:hypothetical protein
VEDHRVSFQVFATGGAGFGRLGDVVKGLAGQADPMKAIMDGLAKFLGDSITGSVNHLKQEPDIKHEQQPSSVKSGTFVTMHWPEIASSA